MYQATIDSQISVPETTATPRYGSLLEKICDRLRHALRFSNAGKSRTVHPHTFIEEYLLDDVMGPEIKRSLRI